MVVRFFKLLGSRNIFLLVIPMPAPETREADPVAVDVAETDAKPLTKDVTGP